MLSALETIQPGSFEPLVIQAAEQGSVLAAALTFFTHNQFAFVYFTTVGFGDINQMLPLARMVSVATRASPDRCNWQRSCGY